MSERIEFSIAIGCRRSGRDCYAGISASRPIQLYVYFHAQLRSIYGRPITLKAAKTILCFIPDYNKIEEFFATGELLVLDCYTTQD